MRVSEGGITLEVPREQPAGIDAAVFYNPRQELNRDITIATLRAFRNRDDRVETYLDGMTASGVRGIRAAIDGWNVTCCDVNRNAVALARDNVERNDCTATIFHRNVNAVLHDSGWEPTDTSTPSVPVFDVVDLDPYGSPMPFADAAFANARNLVCVTATDTAPLCGAHSKSGIRSYSAVPRNTEYHTEMGVRTLLSALARSAARFDVGITPLLTHASSHYVRTYLELDHRATAADATLEALGYVSHCEECLYREWDRGLLANPIETCPECTETRVLTAGPLWLDSPHDDSFVSAVNAEIDESFGTAEKATALLESLVAELDVPTYYDHHKLCKRWGRSAVPMDDVLSAITDAGYEASRTHYGGTTFKTRATVGEIRSATESLHE